MNQLNTVKTELVMKNDGRRNRALLGCDSTMMVSVRSYEERIPKGTFVSLYYDTGYEFCGLDQMLLTMEDIMDSVAMPQPFYEHRNLYDRSYVFCRTIPERRTAGGDLEDIPCLPRGKASFVVRFYCRQHGSMQGELIVSVRKRQKKVAFRSAMELMRLLYEYLDAEIGV